MTENEKEEMRIRSIIHHLQQLQRLIPEHFQFYDEKIDFWVKELELTKTKK